MTPTSRRMRVFIAKMDCPTEEQLIRKELEPMSGIDSLAFNLLERELTVTHSLEDDAPIVAALTRLDMGPQVRTPESPGASTTPADATPWWRSHWSLILSGLAAVASEVSAYALGRETALPVVALAVLSLLTGGLPTLRKGVVAVKTLTLNINFLMTVAIAGAVVIGQWPEAAMVTFLFAVAEAIEGASLERARDAVRGLLAMAPATAHVRRGESWTEVAAAEVAIGDIVRVRPGERIVVDGEVVVGAGSVDQAPITGESIPVEKSVGDAVFAGTLNQEGLLEVRATQRAGDTTLARIARSIQEAQAQRAPTQRFVDAFARIYTPTVVLVAIAVGVVPPLLFQELWSAWVYRALVLLVIACPCALVISTPITVVSGLAAAARRGILVKGGVYLEEARKLGAVALDKTGTLTEGRPRLTDVVPLGLLDRSEVLRLAACLEAGSDHPIARAVVEEWSRTEGQPLTPATDVLAIVGRGIEGRVAGKRLLLGSHALAHSLGACSVKVEAALGALEDQAKTTMVLTDENETFGVLAVADTARSTSIHAIATLHQLGVASVMLTGDNSKTARAIARIVGIDDVRGDLMPEDKVRALEQLLREYGAVGMVGDGVNDAPALARANVGFAMGAAGTDTAIETADVAFMDDDLRKLPELIELSRRVRAVLVQNISFAIGVKAVFLALSLAGVATLWMAIFADMGASLIVVANGLRLLQSPVRQPEGTGHVSERTQEHAHAHHD